MWNEPKIRHIFQPHDAEDILKLRPMEDEEDFPAWHFEKNGMFSVKSAYRLAFDMSRKSHLNCGSSNAGDGSRNIWKRIWKAQVPNKIRIFAWRCAADNLATKRNKWRRTLEIDSTCNICGMGEENSFHATVLCTKAKALRNRMRECWNLPREELFAYTGPDWLLILLENSLPEERPLVLLLLWRAWHLRNNIVHEDGKGTIEASAIFLQNYVQNLSLAGYRLRNGGEDEPGECTTNHPDISTDEISRWKAPAEGNLKLNFDASFIQTSGQATCGGVVRDHNGHVIWSFSTHLQTCYHAEEAEANALLRCLKFCTEKGIQITAVETDCAAVWAALNAVHPDTSSLCYVYREIDKLRRNMVLFSSLLVKRECNSVAHELAKLARVEGISGIWFNSVPDQIWPAIQNDCNGVVLK